LVQSALMPHGFADLTITRPFAWGMLVIGDAEDRALRFDGNGTVSATEFSVIVRVRHAQDVDDLDDDPFAVTVRVESTAKVGGESVEIAVPSGELFVGDGESFEAISVEPGLWRVEVEVEPADSPERVTVRLARVSA
jgi:hypothetical protein